MCWKQQLRILAACGAFLLPGLPARADKFADAQDVHVLRQAGCKQDPASLLGYLRKRTLTRAGLDELERLVRELGHPSYRTRQKATTELEERGTTALPVLHRALGEADPEVVRRAGRALHRIQEKNLGPEVTAAVIRLLARLKPDGSTAALLAFLPFAENDVVAEEARTALAALAKRDGKPDPVLATALKDTHPLRRGAAAEALARAGLADQLPAVRSLIKDESPAVRFRVARALVRGGDKKSLPVLIAGLDTWPAVEAYRALDFLYRVADGGAPHLPLGSDREARGKCRAAWEAWWKKDGARVDLARLATKPAPKGYTLLMLLDRGKLLERDAAGKVRWQFEGLQLPLDLQVLPGERVLVAEHRGNRVTERDFKGQVLWEKKIDEPLMAQRLTNGNTFIATRGKLQEFDPAGKEVAALDPPGGGQVMKAVKLPTGDIACVVLSGGQGVPRFYRLSAFGKPLLSFPVRLNTSGGRIQVLPDGNALVPEMVYDRVVEYDPEGRIVWQARVPQPIAAVRLANGNTLVTTYHLHRAVELNPRGEMIAEFSAEDRVNRALRR